MKKKKRNPNDATMRNITALKKRVAKLESKARVQSLINDKVALFMEKISQYLTGAK